MVETKRILIANRGEIACRLIRTYRTFPLPHLAATPRISTLAIYTATERNSLHVSLADHSHQLPGHGPRAYLDRGAIVDAALKFGCWGVAPGYGFLSEDAEFAEMCAGAGLVFLGPTAGQLRRLGDKVSARQLAKSVGVPVVDGTEPRGDGVKDVVDFAMSVGSGGSVILKAANGGGGRGIRVVHLPDGSSDIVSIIRSAYDECSREAASSFGDGTVYAERFLTNAKHVEVQLIGDGSGRVVHLWDRECSLQRRNQKLIEIAPALDLDDALRNGILKAAVKLGQEVGLKSLATVEFLVDVDRAQFWFMEVNPRIQVEHTVTENVTGLDLVALQLLVALQFSLDDLALTGTAIPFPSTTAIQTRINAESFRDATDETVPEAGTVSSLIWPIGGNVRIETAAHPPHPVLGGYRVNPMFDSLLAKVIVTGRNYPSAVEMARRALEETVIGGVRTNRWFLTALLEEDVVKAGRQHIHTVKNGFRALAERAKYLEELDAKRGGDHSQDVIASKTGGVRDEVKVEEGQSAIKSHFSGMVVKLSVEEGDNVSAGQELVVVEAMKMEHVIRADASCSGGKVHKILVEQGGVINASDVIIIIDTSNDPKSSSTDITSSSTSTDPAEDLSIPRPELEELQRRRHAISDAGRTSAVTKRHARGFLTVRENLSLLLDAHSLIEYGDLALAAQKSRYSPEDLIARTSGDGIVTGFGRIEGHTVSLILGDYMVLAGTQGYFHHLKLDRILTATLEHPAPLVLYAEGGGGRPGDTDYPTGSGLMTPSFALMGQVRAKGIPVVGVANGYVFAGNAALLGTCDVVIATKGGDEGLVEEKGKVGKTSIGMGGKAMIEAGGLGVVESDDIGPTQIHAETGGVDVVVDNETDAAAMTRRIVGFFTQPSVEEGRWSYSQDVQLLRTCLPRVEHRRRAFDMRRVISLLVDDSSFVELAPHWGTGIITGFARIQGQAIAILANDPTSALGGAIDAHAALKATRLLNLLTRTRAVHLISLCDTPGFMVGPEFERTSTAGGSFRTFGEWFTSAAEFTQSGGRFVGLVLRRAFGLGAQAMLGGSTLSNSICATWPAASLGPMSLEGAVQLSMKKQLAAVEDPKERAKVADEAVQGLYRNGRGINVASMAEVDTVLDPAETRDWLGRVVKDVLGERRAMYKVRRAQKVDPHL
ncbi:hypothetical protein PHBOTO_006012 [Pseudozyma hubeiensis]|nr:hypothetical protein PHBOTO_006012 [Pseudozyma hubeiensis]